MNDRERAERERARINAIRMAHYAAQESGAPADGAPAKNKGGRPKKVVVDVTTFDDAETVLQTVDAEG